MLSDAERRRLAEIERDLKAQDPSFAERLSNTALPSPVARWCGLSAVGWLATAVFAAGPAILLKSGVMALIAVSAVCVSMSLWATTDGSRS
jgi:hypothetical protein